MSEREGNYNREREYNNNFVEAKHDNDKLFQKVNYPLHSLFYLKTKQSITFVQNPVYCKSITEREGEGESDHIY